MNNQTHRIGPALVWRFSEAPEELRGLSTNGGDEDWLVEVPPGFDEHGDTYWLMCLDTCREPKEYKHPTRKGWTVVIGAHA